MEKAPSTKISKNMERLARSLFENASEQQEFLDAVATGESAVTGVVWLREPHLTEPFTKGERPDWLPDWIETAAVGERPGKLKAHEDGELYCMDLSSTFACAAFSAIPAPVRTVVDVCASPGGKGIVARRYLSPGLLVGNEVIGKRTAQLISNYKRCHIDPSIVTSLDPEVLADTIPESADVVIVDAPCSGQSLVLKGLAAPGAFHPATIGMNERRQRRILAHSAKLVAPGGYLLYSTCTFSREENENNLEWFVEKFPDFAGVEVPVLAPYRSIISELLCYRLMPQRGEGAGSFCALLCKSGRDGEHHIPSPESIVARLRATWHSPALYASRGGGTTKTTEGNSSRGYKRKSGDKYERHKMKRTRYDIE